MSELNPLELTDTRNIQLFTIGYTEPDVLGRIGAFLENPIAGLVDIRQSPRSRWQPQFNKAALAARYPDQYIHVPELGNVNYKPEDRDKGIVLADSGAGVQRVVYLLEHGHPIMLLCACKDYEQCHRKVVYELIMAAVAESEISNAR